MADAVLEGRAHVIGDMLGGEEFVEVEEDEGGVAAE